MGRYYKTKGELLIMNNWISMGVFISLAVASFILLITGDDSVLNTSVNHFENIVEYKLQIP